MEKIEKRKYPRVKVFSPISYSYVDSDSNALVKNISVALNASQNGIQIETFTEIQSKNIRLRFVDLKKNILEVKGNVIYCAKQQSGLFKIGIKLLIL